MLGCAALTARGRQPARWIEVAAPLPLVIIAALPYLWRFKAQVSGAVFELWPPAPLPFLMFWGGWLLLWLLILATKNPV